MYLMQELVCLHEDVLDLEGNANCFLCRRVGMMKTGQERELFPGQELGRQHQEGELEGTMNCISCWSWSAGMMKMCWIWGT